MHAWLLAVLGVHNPVKCRGSLAAYRGVFDVRHERCVLTSPEQCSQRGCSNRQASWHTPSIAFRHLPPNSARPGYATYGELFISAQLSNDAVNVLRKVWVLIRLWMQHSVQARTYTWGASAQGREEKEFRLDSDDFGYICVGESNVRSYKRNAW